MKTDDKKFQLTVTDNVATIFRLNPGLTLNRSQMHAAHTGTLRAFGPGSSRFKDFGCVKALRYDSNDQDLVRVEFDSGEVLDEENCTNLKAFRERLQEATNFGLGVTGCLDVNDKKMSMLNLQPCRCQCKE